VSVRALFTVCRLCCAPVPGPRATRLHQRTLVFQPTTKAWPLEASVLRGRAAGKRSEGCSRELCEAKMVTVFTPSRAGPCPRVRRNRPQLLFSALLGGFIVWGGLAYCNPWMMSCNCKAATRTSKPIHYSSSNPHSRYVLEHRSRAHQTNRPQSPIPIPQPRPRLTICHP
jgi:hypothetical protein